MKRFNVYGINEEDTDFVYLGIVTLTEKDIEEAVTESKRRKLAMKKASRIWDGVAYAEDVENAHLRACGGVVGRMSVLQTDGEGSSPSESTKYKWRGCGLGANT